MGTLPYYRVAAQNADDFIRNTLTVLAVDPEWYRWALATYLPPRPPTPLSTAADPEQPVVTIEQIKLHCHIEPDQTAEDNQLRLLEMAARIYTAKYLNRDTGDLTAAAPENLKLAMLLLIAHWYRFRETVVEGIMATVPVGYEALLAPEKDYSQSY